MKTLNRQFINGAFVTSHGKEVIETFNPATGIAISQVTMADEVDAQNAIQAAKKAFEEYKFAPLKVRAEYLQRLYSAFEADKSLHLELMLQEYSAPKAFAQFTIEDGIQFFKRGIELLETYEFERNLGGSSVYLEPVGVAAIITPWNGVLWSVCMKLAQALAAGCTVVIKPSEFSALQVDAIAETIRSANLPKGLVNVLNGRGEIIGPVLTKSPDVAKISFTGSTVVGEILMRDGAQTMKRLTLELGGKSPTVILDDAKVEDAVSFALQAGFMNSGQACIAGTRILIPKSRYSEFENAFKKATEQMIVGAGSKDSTVIGPMVSKRQYDRVRSYIQKGIDEGATLLTGGLERPENSGNGYFIKPTIFTQVKNSMTIAREEIFGPVLSLIAYDDENQAAQIANDTNYGLHAYVIGKDEVRAANFARKIQAGRVMVNKFQANAAAPFGGFKKSGLGREFGPFGLEAFLEPKVVLV
ncbi:aldehyde dehydrogenase family protein [Bdellovibrio sp. HCB2-146]|uniref:aldehyde dehydrogenase family protein n=1 Tax=Bdellovibrio sp. HCB2-146 TaxID=3394362 RepID=UPI0039BC6D2A